MAEPILVVWFLAALLAIAIGAAASVSDSLVLWLFEGSCLFAFGLVVMLELRPRIVAWRERAAAIRRFRRQLDAFPEAPHPLDQVARSRSKRRASDDESDLAA